MAVRYGMPVSEFLARHSSAELTELMAHFALQAHSQQQPQQKRDPQEQARLLKQSLFKGT